jgi:hypothetical protein
MRRSTVLKLPFLLVFPGYFINLGKSDISVEPNEV